MSPSVMAVFAYGPFLPLRVPRKHNTNENHLSLRVPLAVFSSFRHGARNIPSYYSKKTDI